MDYTEAKEKGRIREAIFKAISEQLKVRGNPYAIAEMIPAYSQEINKLIDAIYNLTKKNECSKCKHIISDYVEFCGKYSYCDREAKIVMFGQLLDYDKPCKQFERK